MRFLVFPLPIMRQPASDRAGQEIVRAALEPGEFRDRLTREIFITNDPSDRLGLLEHTLLEVVANDKADKKLERAIRKGEVRRFYNNDWIADAERKGILTAEEERSLAELRDLVARVIAVDDFDAAELARGQRPESKSSSHPSSEPMAAE
jgi:acyl-CoA dehydrogenase